jgi:upstream activation factor subunit UAF30
MPTKASKEPKAAKETKAPKQTKAPKAVTAATEKGGKSEPASTGGQKPNALQKPLQPSKELAAVVGTEPLPRGEVVSKVWDYIKKQDLQNPENRREILADDKLEAVFGKKKVTMFEMNKYLAQHLTSPDTE